MSVYYARKHQVLSDHISNVANLAKVFAGVFGCENSAYLAGQLHDMGKYTHAFQDYLDRSLKGDDTVRGEVIHALQGAKYADDTIKDTLIRDIIGNVVATHHGGLFDTISDGERTLPYKLNRNKDKLHYQEAVNAFRPGINECELKAEIANICRISHAKKLCPLFTLHFIVKTVYSCVVDADRCDSAGIKGNDINPSWIKLIQLLEEHLLTRSERSDIDGVRKRISEQCKQGGHRPLGIYTLSVPTGGGKTLSSLRFALEHARAHNLKRIIYVIPYLSILDQTAVTMRDVFKDDGELILEHHSNIELPKYGDEEDRYHLLTSRWDSPIILTTMVQFLETVYSNKASMLRKFHNMSEAVLIFDEIQSLPIKCVHLFNEAVNFLHTFGKSTILLCTATQPHLHKVERPVRMSDKPDVVSLTPEEMRIFERVHIEDATQPAMDHGQIAALVKTQIEQGKSTLVILNTKSDARKVYEQCKSMKCEKAFLTTDLCPAHRLNILKRLRESLDPEAKRMILCVSTQLIEAGVDVSFGCVIRAEAGLDSIIQAAGRCNRNKESPALQSVFVVDVQDEKLSRLQEIKDGKGVTARVFREMQGKNLLSDEVISRFYDYYFYAQKDKMDYSVNGEKTTIHSLLNDNPLGTVAYRNRNNRNYTGLPCAFQTAADAFSVIDGGQTGIVIPYGEAMQLVADFQRSFDPKVKMRILKQLQKYTVSVYSHTLEKIEQAVKIVDNTFYLLNPDYYDTEEYGLLLEAKFSFLNV